MALFASFPQSPYPAEMRRITRSKAIYSRLHDLSDWYLRAECSCANSRHLRMRSVAGRYGGNAILCDTVKRLKCSRCGSKPKFLALTDQPEQIDLAGAAPSQTAQIIPLN